jgi:hypothetical protein
MRVTKSDLLAGTVRPAALVPIPHKSALAESELMIVILTGWAVAGPPVAPVVDGMGTKDAAVFPDMVFTVTFFIVEVMA